MPLIPLIIIATVLLGIGYFVLDLYRNRHRLSTPPDPILDLSGSEAWAVPDGNDSHTLEQITDHISEASHAAGEALGHGLEAIGQALSHPIE
jgi:hypothetical protein